MRVIRRFTVRTVLPEALEPLGRLAGNLRWSWHTPTRDLFESIDPVLWSAVNGDPIALLGELSPSRLEQLAGDAEFVELVRNEADDLERYMTAPMWYQSGSEDLPKAIAYFCAEYGIAAAIPQYSGGLGILAGDHLKSASDLGLPLVGIGLLYQAGYFSQALTRDAWQTESYPVLDPDGLPLTLLREADGRPAVITLRLPGGRSLNAHVWKAQVGRVPLLLLDSNIPLNDDQARTVTDRLYGGGGEHRLQQELLLGIGGVRALRLWSRLTGAPEPEVFHANEGHAGFLGVERIREHVAEGLAFEEALEAVRAGTVFTNHTPVPAGIDRFDATLVRRYFDGDLAIPGCPIDKIMALGAETYAGGDPTVYNMAVMGLRLGGRSNGVSLLHGNVLRDMFNGLWPGFDAQEVPITSVTNGVHSPTWVDRRVAELFTRKAGLDARAEAWLDPSVITDEELWGLLRELRVQLVENARERLRDSWLIRGASKAELGWIDDALSPDVLTIGFARRVPTYKRLTLMLQDEERFKKLLTDPKRPIQMIVAGKSHPADDGGKRLIQKLVQFTDDPELRQHICFLPNYDIALAQTLYPGCDVWLNNPVRPLEACGTSGMKAALNGALNLSILDGWWDEWFDGENGWAIPTADGVEDPDRRDELEAAALYDLIENQVTTRFYERGADGVPTHWLNMIRHTLAVLGPKVQATRQVTDYVTKLYAPAAIGRRAMRENSFAPAKELAAWKARVRGAWDGVRVDHVESNNVADAVQVGDKIEVMAYVSLGTLAPQDVDVQVLYGKAQEDDKMAEYTIASLGHDEAFEDGRHSYKGTVTLDRSGSFGYTVRVVPKHRLLTGPAELALVANAA